MWPHSWHYLINLVRFVTVFTITLVGQADWYEIGNTGYIGQTCQQNIVLLSLKNLSPAPILEKYLSCQKLLDQNFQTKNFRTFIFAVRDCKGSCVTFIQLPISAKQPEAPAEAELSYTFTSAPPTPGKSSRLNLTLIIIIILCQKIIISPQPNIRLTSD